MHVLHDHIHDPFPCLHSWAYTHVLVYTCTGTPPPPNSLLTPASIAADVAMSWSCTNIIQFRVFCLMVLRKFCSGEGLIDIFPYHHPIFHKPTSPGVVLSEHMNEFYSSSASWLCGIGKSLLWPLLSSMVKKVCFLILKELLAPALNSFLKPHFKHGAKL